MESIFTTRSISETKKIGEKIASSVLASGRKRTIVALFGNLGAGKTTLIKSFAKALGIKKTVTSPTFTIIKKYGLKKHNTVFFHIDAYRIRGLKEAESAGIRDALAENKSVSCVEWANRIKKMLPKNTLRISMTHTKKKHERIIKIQGIKVI